MVSRRLSVWQKVVALAPLLLLTVSLPGQVLLRCQMDGLLRSSCCCPPDRAPPTSIPALKTQGCCDREVTVNEPAAAELGRTSAAEFVAAAILSLPAPIALADDASHAIPRSSSHGPPGAGPSIVLLKQSFLI